MRCELAQMVSIQAGFKAAVDVLHDLENENKIRGYIPTENGVRVIEQIFDYLNPHVSTRPLILTGTYGTGKSHLALVIANLLRKDVQDELWGNLHSKVESKWSAVAQKIKELKTTYGNEPYLLVYLEAEKVDWGPGFFDNALILALKESLQREGVQNIVPVTAFDRAIDRIREIKNDFRDAYERLEREVARRQYYSVENFENRLRKHDKQALEDFTELHKLVCAGAPFDRYWGMSASEAYSSIAEAIREKGYRGILLIWDEFTPVLRKLIENPLGGEAMAFQKFAQTCESSSVNKIISMFISIRNIEEMIDRVLLQSLGDESLRRDAEKVSGRFRVMHLGHIDRETYYLMTQGPVS